MAEKNFVNKLQIVGLLKEINLVEKEDDVKIKDKNGTEHIVHMKQIAKNDFKNPAFVVEVNGEMIELDAYPISEKKYNDNNVLEDNPRFKSMQSVLATYVCGETRVKIDGSIGMNGYVTNDGEWSERPQCTMSFISSTNVAEEDSSDADISGVLYKMTEEIKDDVPTGRLIVELATLDNGGNVTPIKMTVGEDLASDFQSYYEIGQSVELTVEVKTRTVGGAKKSRAVAFGRDAKIQSGYTVTEFEIVGGQEPITEEENPLFVSVDVIKEGMDVRNIMIEKKKAEKKDTPKTASPKGAGANKTTPFGAPTATSAPTKKANPFG